MEEAKKANDGAVAEHDDREARCIVQMGENLRVWKSGQLEEQRNGAADEYDESESLQIHGISVSRLLVFDVILHAGSLHVKEAKARPDRTAAASGCFRHTSNRRSTYGGGGWIAE